MAMQIKIPARGIVLLSYDSQAEITHTMVRISEFYESPFPEIRGQRFSLEEYLARYEREYPGANYFADWSGFNIPADAVIEFFKVQDPATVTDAELVVARSIEMFQAKYVIATWRDSDYAHELAHGLYAVDGKYHAEVADLLQAMWVLMPEITSKVEQWLLNSGYAQHVIPDEMNAYITTNEYSDWFDDGPQVNILALGHIREAFRRKFIAAQERNRA